MENLNKLFLEILSELNVLNENLLILSSKDGGIVIHDTFANISTWVDLGITLFATVIGAVIGGWITIQLFKKQEKMRIKQELRLEFYKGYKPLYKKYIDEIIDLRDTVRSLNLISTQGEELKLKVVDCGGDKRLEYSGKKDILDKAIALSKNSIQYFDIMNDYIEMNKINLIHYNEDLYNVLLYKLFNIKDGICELEKWNKEILPVYNSRYTVDDIINGYDRVVKYIVESYDDIDYISNTSKGIHSKLECEFLKQYF